MTTQPANEKGMEAACRVRCQSGIFETGQGTCAPTCMDQLGDARKRSCSHIVEVHGKHVRAEIEAYLAAAPRALPADAVGEIRQWVINLVRSHYDPRLELGADDGTSEIADKIVTHISQHNARLTAALARAEAVYVQRCEDIARDERELAEERAKGERQVCAQGYADSLRQQARWIREALDPSTPESQRIELQGVDTDELNNAADALAALTEPSSVITEIALERKRQVAKEGWSAEHDDEHIHGQLARAAACYALGWNENTYGPSLWPRSWDLSWWKPTDTRRNLVKAGALIVAEIERLDRARALEQSR